MEGGIEQAGGQWNSQQVVGGGPDEILAHDAEGLAGEGEGGGDGGGLGAQEQDVAGFLGEVGAVPMAIPASAWARAAASLMPSPTMATRRPWRWRARMRASLAAGSRPDSTSVIPACGRWARRRRRSRR